MPSAVLVAEPELETRELLGRQLRDDGFDVLGASRRSEALELVETARPSSSSACGCAEASRVGHGIATCR